MDDTVSNARVDGNVGHNGPAHQEQDYSKQQEKSQPSTVPDPAENPEVTVKERYPLSDPVHCLDELLDPDRITHWEETFYGGRMVGGEEYEYLGEGTYVVDDAVHISWDQCDKQAQELEDHKKTFSPYPYQLEAELTPLKNTKSNKNDLHDVKNTIRQNIEEYIFQEDDRHENTYQ